MSFIKSAMGSPLSRDPYGYTEEIGGTRLRVAQFGRMIPMLQQTVYE